MVENRLNGRSNLTTLYNNLPPELERLLPGQRDDRVYRLKAFGGFCYIGPEGVDVDHGPDTNTIKRLIMSYALHASEEPCHPTPFKAFRELPNSTPYVDQFTANAEQILNDHIFGIERHLELVLNTFNGELCPDIDGEDLSIIVRPLPKIKLCYNFYLADNELPASVTCLFSNNALSFLPIDALAELGECSSKKIIELISP